MLSFWGALDPWLIACRAVRPSVVPPSRVQSDWTCPKCVVEGTWSRTLAWANQLLCCVVLCCPLPPLPLPPPAPRGCWQASVGKRSPATLPRYCSIAAVLLVGFDVVRPASVPHFNLVCWCEGVVMAVPSPPPPFPLVGSAWGWMLVHCHLAAALTSRYVVGAYSRGVVRAAFTMSVCGPAPRPWCQFWPGLVLSPAFVAHVSRVLSLGAGPSRMLRLCAVGCASLLFVGFRVGTGRPVRAEP